MSGFGALNGIRVLDLTQMLAGPFGTMMLADHGAEVIKIEAPSGDMTRPAGPHRADDSEKTHGGYFQSVNRNKKSVVLDLKTDDGREALLQLVEDADAICENFRSGVMERLGIGWDVLHARNPRIVYASLNGFGNAATGESPYSGWPAFDIVAQAMGGMIGITGPQPDMPTKIGPGYGDIIPGMMLAFGVVSALLHARKTGQGQMVDVAMVDAVMATCERAVYQHSVTGKVPGPEGNHHPFLSPFGMFRARDGYITLGAPVDALFRKMVTALGIPELANDPRFETHGPRGNNRDALVPLLEAKTALHTKAELQEMLGGLVPFGPVMGIDEIMEDPHFKARNMIVEVEQPGSAAPLQIAGVPIKMTATPGGVHTRGPYLGEHNKDYLD